jgi:predicted NBD/HSP70 family sugar kinase
LTHIVLNDSTTRAAIAAECGLSVASVSNLVTDLMAEGLVVESGSLSSQGGRPITVLRRRPDGAYLVGADVGERGVAVELYDFTMAMVDREFRGGRQEEGPDVIAQDLTSALAELRRRNPAPWAKLAGIGLGLPGIVEPTADGGHLLHAQSLGWPPLTIGDLTPGSDALVLAQNGAKAQAKAEQWFGAVRGVDHAVVALLGRGVGLAVISDGVLQHGWRGSAGEWGHSKVERDGRPCRCGARGCLEAHVGADAMLSAWSQAGGRPEGDGWRAVGQLLDSTDPAAQAVVDSVVAVLGQSLGSLVNLVNPERVVIGGWVGLRLMERLRDRLEAAIRANALDRPGRQFELSPCTFGGASVALGAATLPLEALIEGPLQRPAGP